MEHANLAISTITEDIKHIHVRATAALGIAAVFITQIELDELQALPEPFRVVIVIGMGVLLLSAVAYFLYSQELNKARIKVARRGPATPATIAVDWPHSAEGYTDWLWLYIAGQVLFVAGVLCLGAVVGRLFVG
jgi:hypothetical protein